MGDLLGLGFCVGFVISTCAFFVGFAIAQVKRLIRSIR